MGSVKVTLGHQGHTDKDWGMGQAQCYFETQPVPLPATTHACPVYFPRQSPSLGFAFVPAPIGCYREERQGVEQGKELRCAQRTLGPSMPAPHGSASDGVTGLCITLTCRCMYTHIRTCRSSQPALGM